MFYEKLKNFIRFALESLKFKAQFWLNKLNCKHESSAKFGVANCKKPIFFAYFKNGNVFYVSAQKNAKCSEKIDEIIKVGFENDEFVFYPAREDSAFLKGDFEVDTFHFINFIESSNLNAVAQDIWNILELFRQKILKYDIIYRQRLENTICSVDFADKCGILAVSENLKWEIENAIKAQIVEIAKGNVLDIKEHLFENLFGMGTFGVENISEDIISQDKLLNYYNRSNLANCVENEIALLVKGSLQNEMRFFISYFIDSIFLRANENGKIFADSKITTNSISMQGSPKFCYSNNDLRIEFEGENIYIYNLQKIQIILYLLKSKWIFGSDESNLESNQKIIIKDKKLIKNDIFLKNLNTKGKIAHKIELRYAIDDNEKRFLGNGSIKIADMF